MDFSKIKGAIDKIKGAVKEGVGKATGDERLEAEGRLDISKGEASSRLPGKSRGDLPPPKPPRSHR
jgi:uncharacterized protein YjbJ (UPF0337 family)